MLNQKMTINIDPVQGISISTFEGMVENKKFVNYEDIENIFKQNTVIETGLLPLNTLYYGKTESGYVVVLQLNAQPNLPVKYIRRGSQQVQTFNVPIPYVLFGIVIQNNRITHSECVASKTPVFTENTELYSFPLGNVYNDLRICWGSQNLPEISEPRFLTNIPDLFFNAPFNGDLFSTPNGTHDNIEEFFTRLNGQPRFEPRYLHSRNQTFSDFIGGLKNHIR